MSLTLWKITREVAAFEDDRQVEWEFDGAGHLVVDAPPRHIFRGIGTHAIVASADETTRQEQYAQAIDDMRGGFEPCPDPDCDCKEEE